MSLAEQIQNISTNWREILLKLLDEESEIETWYKKECATFGEILPIYPEKTHIFRCFNYFNIEDTKVVILGQDPYHGPNQAIGLCFGVNPDQKVPPSLKNIMKKLSGELSDSTLESWANQGVLLMNASLTVRHKTPSAHMKYWSKFTSKIIDYLAMNYKGLVFVAWGAFAHKRMEKVGQNHHLIVSSHPSPLSCSRKYRTFPAFKDSMPFREINEKLSSDQKIKW